MPLLPRARQLHYQSEAYSGTLQRKPCIDGGHMFETSKRRPTFFLLLLVAVAIVGTTTGLGSSPYGVIFQRTVQARDTPIFTSYKGVAIGMSADEVREKLGKPKDPSEGLDYFALSDNEYIQVYYDDKKVSAITVTFSGNLGSAPDCKTVFGESAEVKPDGGIFKMVRYPKAGFWISYNKIVGDDPMIMIAIKKI